MTPFTGFWPFCPWLRSSLPPLGQFSLGVSWRVMDKGRLGRCLTVLVICFCCGTSGKEPTCQCKRHKRHGFNPWLGRCPGEGHGKPLQVSCLENPMERGVWWAIVHGVTKSRTRLKGQHTHTCCFWHISVLHLSLHFLTRRILSSDSVLPPSLNFWSVMALEIYMGAERPPQPPSMGFPPWLPGLWGQRFQMSPPQPVLLMTLSSSVSQTARPWGDSLVDS